jgi:NTE family protein
MDEHWSAGHRDANRALADPDVLKRPETPDGVAIFDCTKDMRRETSQ